MVGGSERLSRREILETGGKATAVSTLTFGSVVNAASAEETHPDWSIITRGGLVEQQSRGLDPGPIVIIDPEKGDYSWDTVCDDHSRDYARAVMSTHGMWERFNDIDSVEKNINYHEYTWVRDRIGFWDDYDKAGIHLWEEDFPLWGNIDGHPSSVKTHTSVV